MSKQTTSKAARSESSATDPCSGGFEQALGKLEGIVSALEDGEIGLAEALGRYEEGIQHLRQCYQLLEQAQRKIEVLSGVDAQGNPVLAPFDENATQTLEEKAQSRGGRRSKSAPATAPPRTNDAETTDMDSPPRLF